MRDADKQIAPLELWESVSRTDPAFTKPFSRGGGFRGTATNATYLARRATETFGPCGIGWGVTVLDERVLDGAEGDKVHRVHVRLWYVWQGLQGQVEHFGQTMLAGKNRHGPYTDEEAPKKSLTDAMTKALSLLGFAADVHLGLYDDNKYVAELKAEFAEAKAPADPPKSARQAKADGSWQAVETSLGACGDTAALLRWVPPSVSGVLRALRSDWQAEAREAWRKALTAALAQECQWPSEVKAWGTENAGLIEAMPPEWVNAAREVCTEHLKQLRAAQPQEVLS